MQQFAASVYNGGAPDRPRSTEKFVHHFENSSSCWYIWQDCILGEAVNYLSLLCFDGGLMPRRRGLTNKSPASWLYGKIRNRISWWLVNGMPRRGAKFQWYSRLQNRLPLSKIILIRWWPGLSAYDPNTAKRSLHNGANQSYSFI